VVETSLRPLSRHVTKLPRRKPSKVSSLAKWSKSSAPRRSQPEEINLTRTGLVPELLEPTKPQHLWNQTRTRQNSKLPPIQFSKLFHRRTLNVPVPHGPRRLAPPSESGRSMRVEPRKAAITPALPNGVQHRFVSNAYRWTLWGGPVDCPQRRPIAQDESPNDP